MQKASQATFEIVAQFLVFQLRAKKNIGFTSEVLAPINCYGSFQKRCYGFRLRSIKVVGEKKEEEEGEDVEERAHGGKKQEGMGVERGKGEEKERELRYREESEEREIHTKRRKGC